jgi:peptidoglycan/xylan/chitin deacetylase (PgdA/CDA1 family)
MKLKKIIFTMDVEKNINNGLNFANLLKRNGIRGEFYISGLLLGRYPEKCKTIAKSHMIGCHGYNHERFGVLPKSKQEDIIIKAKRVFEENRIRLDAWRFPFFSFNNLSFHLLVKHDILTDSSLKECWMSHASLIVWLKSIKIEHKLTFPYPFPKGLKELPWSTTDLNRNFLDHEGRIVLHCYNYNIFKDKIERLLDQTKS